MHCPSCGTVREPADRFCAHCGHALAAPDATGTEDASEHTGLLAAVEDASPDAASALRADDAVDGLAPGDAVLLVSRGPEAGARFVLSGPAGTIVTVGRNQDSSIFLDDVTVSRRHVEFRRTPEGWLVADAGSLNGTYVNRDRIDSAVLQDGDEVQVGKYRFLVRVADAA